MSSGRYWLVTMALALLGGFLIVESLAFAPSTASVIAFAVAIAITLVALGAAALGMLRDSPAFVIPPALCAAIGGWTIVAMNVFSAGTEKWLAFASGCGVLGLAVVALALHEMTVERVVHSLEVTERSPGQERAADAAVNGDSSEASLVGQHA
jgi:hypothetical protein